MDNPVNRHAYIRREIPVKRLYLPLYFSSRRCKTDNIPPAYKESSGKTQRNGYELQSSPTFQAQSRTMQIQKSVSWQTPTKKHISLSIYAFLRVLFTFYSSLFTASFNISAISFPAAFMAFSSFSAVLSCECPVSAVLPFLAVKRFTKSGTISSTLVMPS